MERRAVIVGPMAVVGAATTALAGLGHPWVALAAALVPVAAVMAVALPWLVVSVVMFEMALGGWGHALDFGPLSLRQVLVGGLLATWATRRVLTRDRTWPLHGASLSVILALVVMGIALLISLARRHEAALQDGLTPAFLLLFFVFSDLCRTPAGVRRLTRIFVLSVIVLALVQIGLAAAVFVGLADPHVLNERLDSLVMFTVYSPRFARAFLVGSVLFPMSLALLAARWLAGTPLVSRVVDVGAMGLLAVALLLTFTRGFWLVTGVALLLLWLLTTGGGRLRWLVASIVLLLVTVALVATQSNAVDMLSGRVAALFAGGGDDSVAYRLELYPRLLEHIARRPIFGYGVGYPIDGLLYVENSYLYYALKVGLVGTVAVMMGWCWLLFNATRLAWDGATRETRATGAGWAAATVAILVITAINPFINSPVGLYFQTLGLAIVAATMREATTDRSPSPSQA